MRYNFSMRKIAFIIYFIGICLSAPAFSQQLPVRIREIDPKDSVINQHTFYTVTRIVDAQTLVLTSDASGDFKVRLVGVDVPERYKTTKLYHQVEDYGLMTDQIMEQGERAVRFLEELCLDHRVRLDFDPAWNATFGRDKQGRLMAYVFLFRDDDKSDFFLQSITSRDGRKMQLVDGQLKLWLNAELIKEGHARVDRNRKCLFFNLFEDLEKRARKKKRGIWKAKE
jgi:endonuclease YncB( thermonuclease family)